MATTAVVSQYEVTPGKSQDFMAALKQQGEWIKEKGGGDTRVWFALFSGPNSGRVMTVTEADSAAEVGVTTDAVMADWANGPMYQAISAGVATLIGRSIMSEMTDMLG